MSIAETSAGRPTVVIVRGASADASSWSGVIEMLQDDGFPVVPFANPGRGVTSDSESLRALLACISGDVVLVGHSYGGTVISAAATGNIQVKSLVYVGAFAPDAGETPGELAERFHGSTPTATHLNPPFENGEAAGEPAWKTVPSWFLFGARDQTIPVVLHRFMADRAGSRKTIELGGASHTVGVAEAARVACLIKEAAAHPASPGRGPARACSAE